MKRIKDELDRVLQEVIREVATREGFDVDDAVLSNLARMEVPQDDGRCDMFTPCALRMAGVAGGMDPSKMASLIADRLRERCADLLEDVEVAGKGFINVRLGRNALLGVIRRAADADHPYGKGIVQRRVRCLIEFVSANPTGPLSVAHGRQAAVGDALARLLSFAGMDVTREYFINDVGNQINLLGKSIYARLCQLEGKDHPLPEGGYRGEYIKEMLSSLPAERRRELLSMGEEEAGNELARWGVEEIMEWIRKDLLDFGVEFDVWTSQERDVEADGSVQRMIESMKRRGMAYEKDGALWFRGTAYGDVQDRVLVKSDGSWAYRTPDVVYHVGKYERGFDLLVNLWGPDHHAHVGFLKSAMKALGYDPDKLRVLLVQHCTLWRGKEKVKMSTRAGSLVTLREVIDEVGRDAARYFFLMRKVDAHLDFDLELAKKHSLDNPVYYIQYAHARISGIAGHATASGLFGEDDFEDALYVGPEGDLDSLGEEDLRLAKVLGRFPLELELAVRDLEPQRVAAYAHTLSAAFQRFYTLGKKDDRYRVVTADEGLSRARLTLVAAVGRVLRNLLWMMGVDAPHRM